MNVSADIVDDEKGETRPAIALWTLHKDLSRLTQLLAGVARETEGGTDPLDQAPAHPDPRTFFSQLLTLRRTRDTFFNDDLFGEPAWDIMLALMIARIDKREMRISELAEVTHSPGSVTLEHVKALARAHLIERYDDGDDTDDFHISLSSEAARRLAELYRATARS